MNDPETPTSEAKRIDLGDGKYFRLEAVRLHGRFVDAEDNPVDTGNSVIALSQESIATMPDEHVADAIRADAY